MSKSVDETVFDYFSILLSEPSPQAPEDKSQIKESTKAQLKADDSVLGISTKKSTPMFFAKPENQISASQTQQTSNLLNRLPREFAEPSKSVDKLALEKLLSAVSHTAELREPVHPPENLSEQIKQSAAKAKLAITKSTAKITAQAIVPDKKSSVDESVNKEINPLADNINSESSPASIKAAIINKDAAEANETNANLEVSEARNGAIPPSITYDLHEVLDDEFQVLFFNIAGLTLAVPLVSLGGIVKVDKINHLIGRPAWFKGVQTHRNSKINVVDTCAWVMPEKYTSELSASVNYQYLVMLEDSHWGLACESLVNAVKIDKSHVNWREKPGKRPWLAGVVKEQMCGILHVQALIQMLDAGLGCQDSIDRG